MSMYEEEPVYARNGNINSKQILNTLFLLFYIYAFPWLLKFVWNHNKSDARHNICSFYANQRSQKITYNNYGAAIQMFKQQCGQIVREQSCQTQR